MASVAEPEPSHDVFLSYASHDAAIAQALCRGLESSGTTCWIAPRDVTPGAQYADAIVRAINAAKALVVVLSESAVGSKHVGKEIERASAKGRPIIAVRIDAAPLTPALEYFLSESQWIEAPGGSTDASFPRLNEAVRHLLNQGAAPAPGGSSATTYFAPSGPQARREESSPSGVAPRKAWIAAAAAIVVIVAVAAVLMGRRWLPASAPQVPPAVPAVPNSAPATAPSGFSPPPHSVAVLPFVNMSGDKTQDYFTDGLSEELLNSLVTIRDLQVAARTSSFSFKGTTADTAQIARKLNVGALLEGSVRKDGQHVRITAQLINAVTGFHLWSKTYDRDLKDVLKLQTEVATEVTKALQATLMGDSAAHAELGGTQNPQAFDAYLRAEKLKRVAVDQASEQVRLTGYDEAIRLDPGYAKAYIGRAGVLAMLSNYPAPAESQALLAQALAAAKHAVEIAPDMGTAHAAYADALASRFDFAAAASEFERALQLSPGDSSVLEASARFLSDIGRAEEAIASARRAVTLDPLNAATHRVLGTVLLEARRFPESAASFEQAFSLNPENRRNLMLRGFARIGLGQFEGARADCELPPIGWENRTCLAIVYDKLHRPADAKAALDALTSETGDTAAYQYTVIYAQWGNLSKALDWLDTAYRLRDPGLAGVKVDPLMDPLRGDARFRQMLERLKFPQ